MDGWGEKMLATVSTVAEVVAVGLGLERDAFTSRMQMGPHLLAPTGHLCSHSSRGLAGTLIPALVSDSLSVKHPHASSQVPDSRRLVS